MKSLSLLAGRTVEDPGFRNVKKTFRFTPFSAEFLLVYLIVNSFGSMKPGIALNLVLQKYL